MTELIKDHNSSKNQSIKSEFVNREVIHCASYFISCIANYNTEYEDQIYDVCNQPDYERTANEFIQEDMTITECMEYLIEHNGEMPYKGNAKDQLYKYLDEHPEGADFEGFVSDNSLDADYRHEAYEHWIVSDNLGRKLKEQGEMVEDIMGFTVWGRCCTGQAIMLDGVISRICEDMEILDGQKYEWSV